MLEDYCRQVGLPATAVGFVNALQSRLMQVAELTDQGYLENGQVIIGEDGIPVLKRSKAKEMSSGARALETAILERLRERSVIEIPVRRGALDALDAAFRAAVRFGRQDRTANRALRPHHFHLWLQP